jgi:hypothetical protein
MPGKNHLGRGPLFSLPTSTIAGSETGAWGMGPAVVVLSMKGPFVFGALLTQTWTVAPRRYLHRDHQLLLQPP